ncbi:MAG: hypothetical protein BGO55_29305 [Sphingobacteriales bacterium 50-39]|nr:hypothetical protein [Sphingobacteriales bacterium]OJW60639.1 MAG: hypothetical protein BGO55_29305 [Sphingobacteriales bacterium 50-39]
MRIDSKSLFLLVLMYLLCSCGGRDAATTVEVSHVDSAAQAAPDTLRASMDTSSRKKDTALAGAGR